jgi:hypothetical protein
LALSFSALALAPAATACAQWRQAYQSDWLGPAPHNDGFGERVWVDADYTIYWLDGQHLPPLVTRNPVGTPVADAGALDGPTTSVVSGNEEVGDDSRSGVRARAGLWLDAWQLFAFTGDYFNVGEDRYRFFDGETDARLLARPFFNSQAAIQDASFVNVPGQLFGSVRVLTDDEFQSAGLGFQQCLVQAVNRCDGALTMRLDLIAGYRFYDYDSRLAIADTFVVDDNDDFPTLPVGSARLAVDDFQTHNEFHGGELALDGRLKQGNWWLEGLARVAVGGNRRTIDIQGSTQRVTAGGLFDALPGGLLTSDVTNIGRRVDSEATAIPEFRIGIGCQLLPRLSARIGYHVIIWEGVVQAASQLPPNLGVNPLNLPNVQPGGGDQPLFPGFVDTTLVAHGLDLGLELAY